MTSYTTPDHLRGVPCVQCGSTRSLRTYQLGSGPSSPTPDAVCIGTEDGHDRCMERFHRNQQTTTAQGGRTMAQVTQTDEIKAAAKLRWRLGEFATLGDAVAAVTAERGGAQPTEPTVVNSDGTQDATLPDAPDAPQEDTQPVTVNTKASGYRASGTTPAKAKAKAAKPKATAKAPAAPKPPKPAPAPKPTKPVVVASDGATDKQCALCGTTYPATSDNFKLASDQPDGLNPQCKTCRAAYHTDWRARKALAADPTNADLQAKAATAAVAWSDRKTMGVGVVPAKAPRTAKTDGPAVDGTAAQAAALADLEARVAAAGGPETDAGQALLAEAAAKAKATRVRAPRQPKATTTPTGVPAAMAKLPGVRPATPAPKPSQAKRTKAAKAS